MSNEYPPRPTEICEPVYIGTSNIEKRVSTKKYKQSWHVFFGYYRFGRTKRMRTNSGVTKVFKSKHRRYGKKLSDKISFYQGAYPTITRWSRH